MSVASLRPASRPTPWACRRSSSSAPTPNPPASFTSDVDERDRPFIEPNGQTPEGFFRLKEGTGLQHCIARGFAFAEFADLVMGDLASRPQRCACLRRMRPKEVSRQDDGLQSLALAQSRSRHGGVRRTPAAGVRFGSAGLLGNAQCEVGTGYFDAVTVAVSDDCDGRCPKTVRAAGDRASLATA
jgi:hypothetical protein